MIIVTATCWPGGNAAGSYELLHASLTNRSSPGDRTETYMSHVLARPDNSRGVAGYEADVETKGHHFEWGFATLLTSVLSAADGGKDVQHFGTKTPTSRTLARVDLVSPDQFEKMLRGQS